MQPEMMALSVGVRNMGTADSFHFVCNGAVSQYRTPQFDPVSPATARDHIIDGGERVALMVEMAVAHGGDFRLRFWQA